VIFILECSGSEVNEPDLGVEQNASLISLAADSSRGRGYLPVVGEGLIGVVTEQDVFWFEVGVD
jgi:hypothetical protein